MNTRTWSVELMEAMGIPPELMPQKIVESSDIVGGLTEQAAKMLGLEPGMLVCAGGVDCGVANIGLGVLEPGIFAVAIGTSMCAAFVSDKKIHGNGLIVWPYLFEAKKMSYYFGGTSTAGAIVKWFRNTFAEIELELERKGGKRAYDSLNEQAAKILAGSKGLIVLSYFMGERSPVWDSNAKGVIAGLSLNHTKAHINRAFLEAVAYSLRDTMEAFNEDCGEYFLLAGGVTKSELWLQIIADVTGCPVVCPKNDVEANMGDVILAGIGTGWLTYEDVEKWQVLGEKIIPDEERHRVYNDYNKLYHSVYKDLKGDLQKMSELG